MNLELKAQIVRKYGSQADFAKALRVDEPLVSRVIRGRKELAEKDAKRWAEKLGCDVGELFPVDSILDE